MGTEMDADGVPSYLQPDKDHDVEAELNLPSAPIGHATITAGRSNVQVYFHPPYCRYRLSVVSNSSILLWIDNSYSVDVAAVYAFIVQCHVFTASSFVEGLFQTKRIFVFLEEIK